MNFSSILSESIKSKGVKYIATGWVFFISENVVLSHNRSEIITQIGDDNYHRLYNTLSSTACIGLAYSWYYYGRGKGPLLSKSVATLSQVIGFSFHSLGLIGLSQLAPPFQIPVTFDADGIHRKQNQSFPSSSNKPSTPINSSSKLNVRCPIDFKAHREGKNLDPNSAYGVERVSRHSTLWSLGIFCLGSAVSTVFLPEIVMGSFPIIFAYIGSTHQDYRRRNGHHPILTKELEAVTSNIPFVALITGRQLWSKLSEEMKWTNAGMAVATAALIALRRLKR